MADPIVTAALLIKAGQVLFSSNEKSGSTSKPSNTNHGSSGNKGGHNHSHNHKCK